MNTTHPTPSDPAPGLPLRPAHPGDRRRGVLLLVVLSMLTLFMLLGVAYVVAATRAREAARAFARLTFRGDESRVPYAQLLDRTLLAVVRGIGTSGSVSYSGALPGLSGTCESLLADRYGAAATLTGTATGFDAVKVSGTAVGVLSGTVTLSSTCRPTDLCGRILTFTEPGRPVTSHRIIRATVTSGSNSPATAFTVALDAGWQSAPWAKPLATARVIVNGREFAGSAPDNEPWDGFDANNRWLAQVQTDTSSISRSIVTLPSLLPATGSNTVVINGTHYAFSSGVSTTLDLDGDQIPDVADNDGDGVADGVFLDFGLPAATNETGDAVQVRASVLVVDLDGRFNVNAHDALPRLIYAGTTNWSTVSSATAAPLGSGYGPAEINGMSGTRAWTSNSTWNSGTGLFPGPPAGAPLTSGASLGTSENATLFTITGGLATRFTGQRSGTSGSRYSDAQSTPRLSNVEGRYGERAPDVWSNIIPDQLANATPTKYALPGSPLVDDAVSRINDRRTVSGTASDNFGIPSIWWTGTTGFNWGTSPIVAGTSQPLPRGTFNSPPDLHGRMRTITGSAIGSGTIVPQLQFAKAEWADTAGVGARETTDDPYELRLDTRRGFGGLLCDPLAGGTAISTSSTSRDNPFTPAELESVLRPYDIDTNRLPPRLAAMLGSVAEEARLKVTTDSWDTTAITGSAALVLFGTSGGTSGWLQQVTGTVFSASSPVLGVIANEVARGERFDLNRPLAASDPTTTGYTATAPYWQQRQAYCKDLYTLLVALSSTSGTVVSLNNNTITGTAATAVLAQWAANVADFRDADSRVTPFEYDTNPVNGWSVDGDVTTGTDGGSERAVVWGVERPEIVIRETFGWRAVGSGLGSGSSGVVVSLHRPWNATAYGSGSSAIAAEPCDYCLDSLASGTGGAAQNRVNLGKKPGATIYGSIYSAADVLDNSGTVYPIWRLRIVTSDTNYVAFTGSNSVSGTAGGWTGASITSGTQAPQLPVETSFTVYTGTTIVTGPSGTSRVFLSVTGSSLAMDLLTLSTTTSGTVFLERLSDPTIRLTTAGTLTSGTGTVTGSTIWTADPLTTSGTTWPVRYVVVDAMPLNVVSTSASSNITNFTNLRTATTGSAFWGERGNSGTFTWNASTTGTLPTSWTSGSSRWLPWPNRPFVSSAEVTLVPQGDASSVLQSYQPLTPALSGSAGAGLGIPVAPGLLFDAIHVPTRFAGIHRTGTNDVSASTGIFNTVTTVNQFSSFREPGRVNLNTVPADDVWNAVVAGSLPSPLVTATAARFGRTGTATGTAAPAGSMLQLLGLSATATVITSDTAAALPVTLNPLHGIYTATRLANTTTPRSNVLAVWVTLRESVPNDPDSVRYHRGFYLVDRSIPVGFEPGRDHNVRDCIRVRRIIE